MLTLLSAGTLGTALPAVAEYAGLQLALSAAPSLHGHVRAKSGRVYRGWPAVALFAEPRIKAGLRPDDRSRDPGVAKRGLPSKTGGKGPKVALMTDLAINAALETFRAISLAKSDNADVACPQLSGNAKEPEGLDVAGGGQDCRLRRRQFDAPSETAGDPGNVPSPGELVPVSLSPAL